MSLVASTGTKIENRADLFKFRISILNFQRLGVHGFDGGIEARIACRGAVNLLKTGGKTQTLTQI